MAQCLLIYPGMNATTNTPTPNKAMTKIDAIKEIKHIAKIASKNGRFASKHVSNSALNLLGRMEMIQVVNTTTYKMTRFGNDYAASLI